ncbi:MAG: GC-type dockerin domain-anchored protein [Phycisphaerales bacterium JB039]
MIRTTPSPVLVASLTLALVAASAFAQCPSLTPRTDLQVVPNSGPWAVGIHGRTLYVAGGFDQVGPPTGPFALLDDTGAPQRDFVHIEGRVEAATPDGAGGWFIGGDFRIVNGVGVTHLAHIDSQGQLIDLPVLVQGGTSTEIYQLARLDNVLIMTGDFTSINGVFRPGLAAVDATTGALLGWAPTTDSFLDRIVVADGRLYVTGGFTTIAGEPRNGAASFEGPQLDLTPWNPLAWGGAGPIEVAGDSVYLFGDMRLPSGLAGRLIVEVDAISGAETGWSVTIDGGGVRDLLATDDTIYAAGRFDTIGGVTRTQIAAVDRATADVLPFDVSVSAQSTPEVSSLAMTAFGLALAGEFDRINAKDRRTLAIVDPVSGDLSPWAPMVGGKATAVWPDSRGVIVGGDFVVIGGVPRAGAAAYDLDTGALLPWNPALEKRDRDASFVVYDLVATADRIYLSGTFEKIDGLVVNGLAAVSPVDGSLDLSFDHAISRPVSQFGVQAMVRTDGEIHAMFSGILYGLDEQFGDTLWFIEPLSIGTELAASDSYLYALTRIEQTEPPAVRAELAELEPRTGKLTSWDPMADGDVRAVATWKDKVIVGGRFDAIGGEIRPRLAVFEGTDPATRRLAPAALWEFGLGGSDSIRALTVGADLLIVGGSFSSIHGEPVTDNAIFQLPDLIPCPWPYPELRVRYATAREAIVSAPGHIGGVYMPNLAILPIGSPCRADLTGDGALDLFDFLQFQNLFAVGDPIADFTGDGIFDLFDFLAFQNEFAMGCP